MILCKAGKGNDLEDLCVNVNLKKKSAILFSGGAASTLLLYLMCKDVLQKGRLPEDYVDIFVMAPPFKKPLLQQNILLDQINALLGIKLPNPTILDIESKPEYRNDLFVRLYTATEMLTDQGYDNIYITSNILHQSGSYAGMNRIAFTKPGCNVHPLAPFRRLTKYHVIDLYHQLGITDLMQYTRHCERELYDTPCGKCYKCIEHSWATRKFDNAH